MKIATFGIAAANWPRKRILHGCALAVFCQSGPPADVIFDGQPLFRIYSGAAQFSTAERAALVSERLERLAQDRSAAVSGIQLHETEGATKIFAGDQFLVAITDADSLAEERRRKSVAESYARRIRGAIAASREVRSWRTFLLNSAYAVC